jgi:DNA-binding IclR family transcriptional regulator
VGRTRDGTQVPRPAVTVPHCQIRGRVEGAPTTTLNRSPVRDDVSGHYTAMGRIAMQFLNDTKDVVLQAISTQHRNFSTDEAVSDIHRQVASARRWTGSGRTPGTW